MSIRNKLKIAKAGKESRLSVANFDSLKLTLDSFKARGIFLTQSKKNSSFLKVKIIPIIYEHEYFIYRLLSQSFKHLVSSLRFRKFLTVNPSDEFEFKFRIIDNPEYISLLSSNTDESNTWKRKFTPLQKYWKRITEFWREIWRCWERFTNFPTARNGITNLLIHRLEHRFARLSIHLINFPTLTKSKPQIKRHKPQIRFRVPQE